MRELLQKYYRLDEKDRGELYCLFLLNEIEQQLKEYEETKMSMANEEKIFKIANKLFLNTDVSVCEIVDWIIRTYKEGKVSLSKIVKLGIDDLIEMFENDYFNDFYSNKYLGKFKIQEDDYIIIQNEKDYILVRGEQRKFDTLQELLSYAREQKVISEE